MENALSLKYRPQRFSEVQGQDHAIDTLEGLIKDKLPPTILICGPHAVGKTTLARILARRMNCEKPKGPDPCLKCRSCLEENHQDIREINAAEERGIGTIRRLQDISRLAPAYKRLFIILDECHALTPQAYQASLKMFEEPAPSTHFVLVTTNPEKMPTTISSRCSVVKLRRLATEPLAKFLFQVAKKEGMKLPKEVAEAIADSSGGHPREALNMLQQLLSRKVKDVGELGRLAQKIAEASPRQMTVDFLAAILECDMQDAVKIAAEAEESEHFLATAVDMLRALLVFKMNKNLSDGYYRTKFAKEPFKGCHFRDVADILRTFGLSFQQAKSYLLDADTALCLAIVDSIPEDQR